MPQIRTRILLTHALALSLATALGCAGQKGDPGQAGPAGPQGSQGVPGNAGPAGIGLRASYDFEEGSGTTTVDASGAANQLTLAPSGVSWTTAGHTGNALNFDGASGYVEAPNASLLNPREEISASAWVYQTGNASNANTVLSKDNSYALRVLNGQPQFAVQTLTGPAMAFVGGGSVPLNTWTHLKGTYDGVAIRLYVNGQLALFTAYPNGILKPGAATLRIGATGAGADFFTGRIDEVRVAGIATGDMPQRMITYVTGLTDQRNNSSVVGVGTWWSIPGRSVTFTKLFPSSLLRINYQDTLGTNGTNYDQCEWRILVDSAVVSAFSDADMTAAAGWRMQNSSHQAMVSGVTAGAHTVIVQNRRTDNTVAECLQGWNQSGSFLSVEELP